MMNQFSQAEKWIICNSPKPLYIGGEIDAYVQVKTNQNEYARAQLEDKKSTLGKHGYGIHGEAEKSPLKGGCGQADPRICRVLRT